MGFIGKIFSGSNPSKGFIEAANYGKTRGGFAGGYGAWTFGNIINAHSSAEDIVEEFGLDQDDAAYGDCWDRAYREVKAEAQSESIILTIMGMLMGEELEIDYNEVEERAYEYALQLAQDWIDGGQWIPREVLYWAYYDVSSHNG